MLKNLSVAQKLLLICLAFALPLFVQLYFMAAGFQEQIYKAEKEIAGNRFVASIRVLLTRLPEHGRLSHQFLEGSAGESAPLEMVRAVVDAAFDMLVENTRVEGELFKLDPDSMSAAGRGRAFPPAIRTRWRTLRGGLNGMKSEASDKAHGDIVKDLNLLLIQVGEASGLYLDPDLDSFYIMDASIRALQRVQAQISLALLVGTTVPGGPAASADVKGRLSGLGVQLREVNLARVKEEVTAAIREDATFYGESDSLQRDVPPRLADLSAAIEQFVGLMDRTGKDSADEPTAQDFLAAGQWARRAGIELWDTMSQSLEDLLKKRISSQRRNRNISLLLSLMSLLAALCMVAYVARGITRPLDRVMRLASLMSEGDLAGAKSALEGEDGAAPGDAPGDRGPGAARRDEVARLSQVFTQMTIRLESLLSQVGKTGDKIFTSTSGMAEATRLLEANIAEQAAATSEVSATSREISVNASVLADSVREVTSMVLAATDLADSGRSGVGEIQNVMRAQLRETDSISGRFSVIREKAGEITEVVTAITQIAGHVNLLSLNAAIEAEKAGGAGAGFSVVAREMRRLADRAADAAVEISEMVGAMTTAVADGVEAMSAHSAKTLLGSKTVDMLSENLCGVIDKTRELEPHMERVDRGVQSQSESAGHIRDAMAQLHGSALQTRQALSEFSTVLKEVDSAVHDLRSEMAGFRRGSRIV